MENKTVRSLIDQGLKHAEKIDELSKKSISFSIAWDFIQEVNEWTLASCSQLTLLGEDLDEIKILMSQNPSEQNMLLFVKKITDWNKGQQPLLKNLKSFIILINKNLIRVKERKQSEKIIYFSENTIYTSNEYQFDFKEGKKRTKLLLVLLKSLSPISGTKLVKKIGYRDYSLLSKEIGEINKILKKKIKIKHNLIIRNKNNGYEINRKKYNLQEAI